MEDGGWRLLVPDAVIAKAFGKARRDDYGKLAEIVDGERPECRPARPGAVKLLSFHAPGFSQRCSVDQTAVGAVVACPQAQANLLPGNDRLPMTPAGSRTIPPNGRRA